MPYFIPLAMEWQKMLPFHQPTTQREGKGRIETQNKNTLREKHPRMRGKHTGTKHQGDPWWQNRLSVRLGREACWPV